MLEAREDLALVFKLRQCKTGAEATLYQFDSHLFLIFSVGTHRAENNPHPALANNLLDAIGAQAAADPGFR